MAKYGVKVDPNIVCVCCWMVPQRLSSKSIFLTVTAVGNLVWKGWVKGPTKKGEKKLPFSVSFSRLVQLAHCALATLGIVAYRTISLGVKNSQFACERKARWFTRFETTWTTDIENLSPCPCWSDLVNFRADIFCKLDIYMEDTC